MTGIRLVYDNYVKQADLEQTEGGANEQFPLANLQNASPSIKWRSDGNTAKVVFDLKQTRNIDSVIIIGDPVGTFGVTAASVKFSTTTDFSSADPVTINLSSDQSLGYAFFDETSRRYVELTLTGTGSYAEVGAIMIGARLDIPQNNLSIDSFSYGHEDLSRVQYNRYGQAFIDRLPQIKSIGGTLEFATKAEQSLLDDTLLFSGTGRPIFMMVDINGEAMEDGEFKLAIYGYVQAAPVWSAAGGQHYSTTLNVRQAV